MVIPGVFEKTEGDALQKINLVGNVAPKIQLDIADGLLVDGKTFVDLTFISNLNVRAQIQLHLMVQRPESFLTTLPSNIKDMCVQAEAFLYNPLRRESLHDVLKAKGMQVGLSFNTRTPFDDFKDWIEKCDYIQLMGVNPGGQSRPFIMQTLDKIGDFKRSFPNVLLQVDGGIAAETLKMVAKAGVDNVVIGSAVFKSPNPTQTYRDFVLQFENARRHFLDSRRSQS